MTHGKTARRLTAVLTAALFALAQTQAWAVCTQHPPKGAITVQGNLIERGKFWFTGYCDSGSVEAGAGSTLQRITIYHPDSVSTLYDWEPSPPSHHVDFNTQYISLSQGTAGDYTYKLRCIRWCEQMGCDSGCCCPTNGGVYVPITVTITDDTTPPAFSFDAPADGTMISPGQVVQFRGSASDNSGYVYKIRFSYKAPGAASYTMIGECAIGAASCSVNWTVPSIYGDYKLLGQAFDDATPRNYVNKVISASTNDIQNPSVAITAPAYGAVVKGGAVIAAAASDNVGVTEVKFFVEGALKCTATASPYTCNWNTSSGKNGPHELTATAFDAAGNQNSVSVKVQVNNPTGGGGWRRRLLPKPEPLETNK